MTTTTQSFPGDGQLLALTEQLFPNSKIIDASTEEGKKEIAEELKFV